MGRNSVEVVEVPDPTILDDRDAVVRVTSTAICGSDLHLYDGYVPEMKRGDVLGHEFMGEVVETGKGVGNLQVGDRVVVPFPIACGGCTQCRNGMTSICENSNPNAGMAEKLWGRATSGIFGYSHLTGGYAGGQAEFVRVPFADVGPMKVPSHLSDEQVLFLTDIFPTGYMGAELCDITEGDTIAVWGAARSASSPPRAPSCSAPTASSSSTATTTGSTSCAPTPAPRRSTTSRSTCATPCRR
jgi:threonine dehydrogenase-like Zn-dependent dehydrogenase